MTWAPELQPGPCSSCGALNYSLSMGGPTICPKCDCGTFDSATVLQQAKIINRLRSALAEAELKCEIMCDLAYAHGAQAANVIPDDAPLAKERFRLAMERMVLEALAARRILAKHKDSTHDK